MCIYVYLHHAVMQRTTSMISLHESTTLLFSSIDSCNVLRFLGCELFQISRSLKYIKRENCFKYSANPQLEALKSLTISHESGFLLKMLFSQSRVGYQSERYIFSVSMLIYRAAISFAILTFGFIIHKKSSFLLIYLLFRLKKSLKEKKIEEEEEKEEVDFDKLNEIVKKVRLIIYIVFIFKTCQYL